MNFTRAFSKAFVTAAFVALLASISKAQQVSKLPIADVAPNTPSDDKAYKPSAKILFSVFGRSVEDEFSRSHQGVTVVNPEIFVKYGDVITLGLDFAAFIGTGNASNFWNDDGKAPNTFILFEGFAKVNLHKNIFVRAGAIRTPLNPLTSIMTPGTFMGFHEEWQIGADNSNITLNSYQAIPSAGTVSRRIYDDGTQAYFLSQTIMGKLKSEETGSELRLAATRFQFENLSTNVANDSYFLGNSLASFEGSSKSFRFRHGFMGTESAINVKQALGAHELFLFGSTILNDEAPVGKNDGNIIGASIKLVFGNYAYRPSYSVFNYEADVTPTTYTTLTARFHNRTGYRFGFDIELLKEKLALKNYYIKMDLKDANPYLADREVYNIALEAKYDIF